MAVQLSRPAVTTATRSTDSAETSEGAAQRQRRSHLRRLPALRVLMTSAASLLFEDHDLSSSAVRGPLLAAASGLQHALAMLAGLITPPIIFASALSLDSATSAYMISASLIGCGE